MKTLQINPNGVLFQRWYGHLIAIALLLVGLGLTGCDAMDPNAVEDEPHDNALFAIAKKAPEAYAMLPADFVPVSELDGSWTPASASADEQVTFTTERVEMTKKGMRYTGRFSGQTACSDFSGKFSALNGDLKTKNLVVEPTRCNVLIEEPLILGLRSAIGYKRAEDTLFIVTEDERSVLTLNRVADGLVEGDDDRAEAFAPPPDDRPAPNPNDALTNHSDEAPDPICLESPDFLGKVRGTWINCRG